MCGDSMTKFNILCVVDDAKYIPKSSDILYGVHNCISTLKEPIIFINQIIYTCDA